jgi:hypothetical protein
MSDNMRWRHGDTKPRVTKAIATATVVEIGDLVEASSGTVQSAADHTWNSNIAVTQEEFHDIFLGVAMQRSRSGDTDPIRVATAGVFEFTCAAATFEIGDLVGPAKATGNAMENQKVVAVATANLAIGRVAKRYAANTTTVLVEVESTVQRGGPQAAA